MKGSLKASEQGNRLPLKHFVVPRFSFVVPRVVVPGVSVDLQTWTNSGHVAQYKFPVKHPEYNFVHFLMLQIL